jgi:hypothetical protein
VSKSPGIAENAEVSEDDIERLKQTLYVSIKERLTVSINHNPEVVIRLPCRLQEYSALFGASTSKQNLTLQDMVPHFGDNWWVRITNRRYDFAYVCSDGMFVYLSRARPLVEYVQEDGVLVEQLTDRGHNLTFRFLRDYGSRREWEDNYGTG